MTTTQNDLRGIEKTCEWDEQCPNTAVSFRDGTPVCDYHASMPQS